MQPSPGSRGCLLEAASSAYPGDGATTRSTPLSKGADATQSRGGILNSRAGLIAFSRLCHEPCACLLSCSQGIAGIDPEYGYGSHWNTSMSAVENPPARAARESAPFDKGVNPAMPRLEPGDLGQPVVALIARNLPPPACIHTIAFARHSQPRLSGNHWQRPCALSRRKRFIVRLHHSGPPSGIRYPQFRSCHAQASACHRIPEPPCLHSNRISAPASSTA
jgi:hypothetical protein